MMRKCLCSEVPRLLNVHQGIFIGTMSVPRRSLHDKTIPLKPGASSLHAKRRGMKKKKMADLPPDIQAQIRALENLLDDQIDTTDAPEILDWSNARRGVFYRPGEQQRRFHK